MSPQTLRVQAFAGAEVFKALSSPTRLRILSLLAERERNINELAEALGMAQPTVSRHTQVLEQAGLVRTEYGPGAQGTQKRCALRYDRLSVSFEGAHRPSTRVEETAMPIGLYTHAEAAPTCGLASPDRIIGMLDDPQAFYHPDRAQAQILWLAAGFVEYVFPCTLPATAEIERLELVAEVCSEAPHHNPSYPSDITVSVNGVQMATWTSPGDLGERRGRLNPDWWDDNWSQHGMLKVWAADRHGAYVDGTRVSDVTIADLALAPLRPITIRISAADTGRGSGGLNLFGRGFGNYEQDLILRVHYRAGPADARSEATGGFDADGSDGRVEPPDDPRPGAVPSGDPHV